MGYGYIIAATDDGAVNFDPARIQEAIAHRWPGAVLNTVVPTEGSLTYDINTRIDNGPVLIVSVDVNGTGIYLDGFEDQIAQVAALVRSLLPEMTTGEIWLFDGGDFGHVKLTYGIAPDQIWPNWIRHSADAPIT